MANTNDTKKTKAQLIEELQDLRRQVTGLQKQATGYEQVEQTPTQDQLLLRALLDNAPDQVYFKDAESRFIRIGKEQAARFGLGDPAEAVGKTDFDFFTAEHAQPAYEDEQEIIRTGQPIIKEEKETWPDGRETWVSTAKMPLRDEKGNIIGTFGISRDITERKQAEKVLERHALQLQTTAEVAQAASTTLDPGELMQQVVDLVCERFDLYYVGLFLTGEAVPQDEPGNEWAVLRAGTGEAGQQMVAQEYRLELGDTSTVSWCIANKQPCIAPGAGEEAARPTPQVRFNPLLPETRSEMALPLVSHGEAIGALTIQSTQETPFSEEDAAALQTIADQLANAITNARLLESLAREQSLMNALVDNAPDYIYFKDRESRFIRTTRSHAEAFGLSDPAEAIGKSDFDFFSHEHAQEAYVDEQRIIRTGEPVLDIEERETWPDRPDTWVMTSKMPLRDKAGKTIGTFGISSDITARKRAELALERRAVQLQATATVAREAAAIQNVDQLLNRTVRLVSDEFGFYHTSIYLMGEAREYAILRAASSEGGQRLLARDHKVQIGDRGIVARVARTGEPRIATDVGQDDAFLINPDLPDTRSEMALPLKVRGLVVGVLDVQTTEEEAFSEEDVATLQTLADQVALAIQNVRLLRESQESLRELETLYGQQAREAWRERTARAPAAYRYTRVGVESVPSSLESELPEEPPLPESPAAPQEEDGRRLVAPLSLHGQTIGHIVLRRDPGEGPWLPEEVALANTISTQISLALENARLLEDTRQRAERDRLTASISARVRASMDLESIMQDAVRELGMALGADRVFIRLGADTQLPEPPED